MFQPLFAIPLNMGAATWSVAIFCSLAFLGMFGLASSKGDYQGLIDTTLSNDAIARERRKNKR